MSCMYDTMMAIESKEHGKELCGNPEGILQGILQGFPQGFPSWSPNRVAGHYVAPARSVPRPRPVTTNLQFGNIAVTTEA